MKTLFLPPVILLIVVAAMAATLHYLNQSSAHILENVAICSSNSHAMQIETPIRNAALEPLLNIAAQHQTICQKQRERYHWPPLALLSVLIIVFIAVSLYWYQSRPYQQRKQLSPFDKGILHLTLAILGLCFVLAISESQRYWQKEDQIIIEGEVHKIATQQQLQQRLQQRELLIDPHSYQVTVRDPLHLRAQPSTLAKSIKVLPAGTQLTIDHRVNDWCHTLQGWVNCLWVEQDKTMADTP